MRRTLPAAALTLATVVGLAAPAMAEEPTTPTRAPQEIDLTCHEVTVDGSAPAIHCEWDAYDGATTYRVVATVRRGNHGQMVAKKTEETSFTRKDVRPGRYTFLVQALGEDGKPVARSDRERVVVGRDARTAS